MPRTSVNRLTNRSHPYQRFVGKPPEKITKGPGKYGFFKGVSAEEMEALRSIRVEQRATNLCLNRDSIKKIVQEVMGNLPYSSSVRHFEKDAFEAMHWAAEDLMIKVFEDANLLAIHGGRDEILPKDVQLAMRVGGHNASPWHAS